jgi:hypothetical protein
MGGAPWRKEGKVGQLAQVFDHAIDALDGGRPQGDQVPYPSGARRL